jgi:hypothetical protein
MTPMAHRAAPARPFVCPGCATCRASERRARRERMLALAVLVVFAAVFVLRLAVPA